MNDILMYSVLILYLIPSIIATFSINIMIRNNDERLIKVAQKFADGAGYKLESVLIITQFMALCPVINIMWSIASIRGRM